MDKQRTNPPDKEPALRTTAMPADTNADGDIFGGWLLSQMDLAGANVATRRADCRVATVGIDSMSFHKPVYVGDELSCYATIETVGDTSLTIDIQAWVRRSRRQEFVHVTEGIFTYVALNDDRRPTAIDS
ncbi:MAG: acyl-CoA thioesterase [bacterium]